PLHRADIPRLVGIAILGAAVAPACLAWGLHRTSATSASLLLNFEAVFTVLLARVFHHEPIGKRVGLAVALMIAACALLLRSSAPDVGSIGLGMIPVLYAALGWACDNTLMRPLADADPSRVAFWKSALGALASASIAFATLERLPSLGAVLGLLVCGAIGYGASLRLYLLAQRQVGAARTGSIFAVAPFVGAMTAFAMGERDVRLVDLGAGALFALAVYLHMTEKHRHLHAHAPLEHEHAHRHDDGHHAHVHDEHVEGVHSHSHRHEPQTHSHPQRPTRIIVTHTELRAVPILGAMPRRRRRAPPVVF
ncbi:MAG: EamA family transporter, partial [Polyangiaceae bacterium]